MDRWTMAQIRACNRERGQHWFERGTMRFFNSRVGRSVYQGPGGVYFVSSEKFEPSSGPAFPRKYSVRKFNPKDCSVDTVGDFQRFGFEHAAADEAKRLARGR